MKKREIIKLAISGVCLQMSREEDKIHKGNELAANRLKELRGLYDELLELGFKREDLEEEF